MQKRLTIVFLLLLAFLRVGASEQKPYSKDQQSPKFPVIYFTDVVRHIEMLSASTEFLMKGVRSMTWLSNLQKEGNK